MKGGKGTGDKPIPLRSYYQSPIYLEENLTLAVSMLSKLAGIYYISIILVSKGFILMMLFFNANCSGFVLMTLMVALALVGFSSSASINVETPKGDLILLMTTGAFA